MRMDKLKRGSLLIEALVAIVILMIGVAIAMVSSYNLLKKSYENKTLAELSDVLINECEEIVSLNVSQIHVGTSTIEFGGRKFTVSTTPITYDISSNVIFLKNGLPNPNPPEVAVPSASRRFVITKVIIKITDEKGRYIETQVVPKQW